MINSYQEQKLVHAWRRWIFALTLLAIPLVAASLTIDVKRGRLAALWATWMQKEPVAEFPEAIDLGEQEIGQAAAARFPFGTEAGKTS